MDWRRGFRLLPLLGALLLVGSCMKRTPSLNLLVWEGYADPSFIKAFEDENHCKVSASYMGSSDELVAKLRGGSAGNYDVISPSSDVATSIATAGLAAPLDLSKIPSYSQLSPQLVSLPLVRANSQVHMGCHSGGDQIPSSMTRLHSPRRRIRGTSCGTRNTKRKFPYGTISPRCTWPRNCSAMTSPILRTFTT